MRNPYKRPGDRPPATCSARGLSVADLDRLAARRPEPVRAGAPNPWRGALSKVAVRPHALHHDKASPLALAVLGFGGASALVRSSLREAEAIVERGQLWPAIDGRLVGGASNRCHDNACLLWGVRQDALVLATGYCLDEDGLWRQHSWCIDVSGPKPAVVETTGRRLLYFGMALTAEESIGMCRSQLDWSPRLARAPSREDTRTAEPEAAGLRP
jgi:hypothetical protein